MRSSMLALLLCSVLPSAPAFAQAAAPAGRPPLGTPVNGTIQTLDGSKLVLAEPDGTSVTVLLGADTNITFQQKAAFSDIQPHDFVASAGMLRDDGKTHAQEVRIFPEKMRGAGEGHRPMALPNQTMTNATVTQVGSPASMTNATVTAVAGGVLTTVYPGGSTEIVVDPGTPIWRIVPTDRSRLTPGSVVRAFSVKADDGSLHALYVAIQ